MATDSAFFSAVAELTSPRMGTELMGPLLYSLVRSVRAERIVEIGAGLTTLYLLKGLSDNRNDFNRERTRFEAKQRLYNPEWNESEGTRRRDRENLLRWLEAEPALGDPDYYGKSYEPRCVSVDDNSSPFSTASRVAHAAEAAGLASLLELRRTNFRAVAAELHQQNERFQFAWFDCGGAREYQDFLDLYWDMIEPEGGILILHYTLTVPSHEDVIEKLMDSRQRGVRGAFELLNLREPHKLMQNSCTLIRRAEGTSPTYPLTRSVSLERSGS